MGYLPTTAITAAIASLGAQGWARSVLLAVAVLMILMMVADEAHSERLGRRRSTMG